MKYQFIICFIFISLIFTGCSKRTINIQLDPQSSGLTIYKYDISKGTASTSLSFHGAEFDKFVTYFSHLKGVPKDRFDNTNVEKIFYGIEMNDAKLLIIGDRLITGDGKIFEIDGEKAIGYCEAIKGDYSNSNLEYIINQRYISLIDNTWDTTYMIKVKNHDFSKDIQWVNEEEAISDTTKQLKTSIINNSESEINFDSRIYFEVLINDDWYSIDSMTHSNVNLAWDAMLHILKSNDQSDLMISLDFFQPLPKGKYRLVKQIFRESKEEAIYLEFMID